MNIYDTNESVELYDNRGIEMARKCIRRAKRECALRYLILLLLFALGMVDKILFPQIEIKLSSYILLYVICMFSMMGFRIFHNGIVAKRMKDFTLQEKHDYNLVIYRENHNKKFFLKSITLLTMLMCHKVTHKNLIDSSPLFRYCLTHASCNFFVKTIDSDTSKEI